MSSMLQFNIVIKMSKLNQPCEKGKRKIPTDKLYDKGKGKCTQMINV